jgi:hypothetical protein
MLLFLLFFVQSLLISASRSFFAGTCKERKKGKKKGKHKTRNTTRTYDKAAELWDYRLEEFLRTEESRPERLEKERGKKKEKKEGKRRKKNL